MKQASLDLKRSVKKVRKREFLEQMERVLSRAALVVLITPYYPGDRTGRPPFALKTMLSVYLPSAMVQSVGPRDARNVL